MIPDTPPLDDNSRSPPVARDEPLAAGGAPDPEEDPTVELWDEVQDDKTLRGSMRPQAERLRPGGLRRLGRFEIIREIGYGGYGVVYLAHDPTLGRGVALKVPRSDILLTPAVRLRFLREARAAAGLDHPNLVPVHEAGEVGPVCYIASTYCEGPTLSDWLRDRSGPVPARLAARLVATLADAVQHAHDRGILHRDLKPGNVLLQAPSGGDASRPGHADLSPRVTDFGLARLIEDVGDEHQHAVPMGSPPYMAPEQAVGRAFDVGPATDVYALGACLYEILTGRPPFRGEVPMETLRQVLYDPPVAPRALRPGLPRDLETICLTCLSKEPGRRYASAAALRDDLGRFLAEKPILARPGPVWRRGLMWAHRRPEHATLSALIVLVVLGLIAGLLVSDAWLRRHNRELRRAATLADRHRREAERQRQIAEEQKARAQQGEWISRRHLHAARLRMARQAWDAGQIERTQDILRDERAGRDCRGFAWHYLWRLARRDVSILWGHTTPVLALALSPDGKTLATGEREGFIFLWDLATGRARATLKEHSDRVDRMALAFSPRGRLLASLASSQRRPGVDEVLLWDAAAGRLRARLENDDGVLRDLAFLAGGRALVAASVGPADVCCVRRWDLAHALNRPRARRHLDGARALAFSADGLLAVLEPCGELTIRDAALGRVRATLSGRHPDLGPSTFSRDGRTLAAAREPAGVTLWDTETGRERATYEDHEARVVEVLLNADGSALAAVDVNGEVSIRELASGERRILLPAGPGRSIHMTFSPDGTLLALGGRDGPSDHLPITLWDARTANRLKTFPGQEEELHGFAFTADGRTLVIIGVEPAIRLWHLDTPPEPDDPAGHAGDARAVAFSPDGRVLASAGDDATIRLWDSATGAPLATLTGHTSLVFALAFRPDGRTLASASFDKTVKLWDVATRSELATLTGHTDSVRAVAFSPDGAILASAGNDQSVRLWDMADRSVRAVLTGHSETVRNLAFSSDGATLASAGNDQSVRLWDVAGCRERCRRLWHSDRVTAVAFSPDGATLASADEDGIITLWDPTTGVRLRDFNSNDGETRCLAYSPDGRVLASAGIGCTIRLWDSFTDQDLLSLEGHRRQVNAVAFSPDGRTLASASHEGAVKFWRAGPREDPGPRPRPDSPGPIASRVADGPTP